MLPNKSSNRTENESVKKRILIVDDEETLRLTIQQVLSEDGYEVVTAKNGLEALDLTRAYGFDLVITDLRMPGLTGFQLISEIKKTDPLTKFIVISAYGTMDTVIEAMRLGVNDYAAKPFKVKSMKETVNRVFRDAPKKTSDKGSGQLLADIGRDDRESDSILIRPNIPYYMDKSQEASSAHSVFFDAVNIAEKQLALIFGSMHEDCYVAEAYQNAPLLGTMVKAVFRTIVTPFIMPGESDSRNRPKHVVDKINKYLCLNTTPRIPVSLFCALIDEGKGVIEYVNHGQKLFCSLIHNTSKIETLDSTPYPLNQFPDLYIEEKKSLISSKSKLILSCSDSFAALSVDGKAEKADLTDALLDACSSQDIATNAIDPSKKEGQSLRLGKETVRKIRANLFDSVQVDKPGNDWVVMGVNLDWRGAELKQEKMVIPATTNDFRGIVRRIEDILKGFSISPQNAHGIITAVNEAVINARVFAYKDGSQHTNGGKHGDIMVTFMVIGNELIVEVFDGGSGFNTQPYNKAGIKDYQSVTADSGRGIFLIKKLMERVMIQSSGNIGTRVYMAKEVVANGS